MNETSISVFHLVSMEARGICRSTSQDVFADLLPSFKTPTELVRSSILSRFNRRSKFLANDNRPSERRTAVEELTVHQHKDCRRREEDSNNN